MFSVLQRNGATIYIKQITQPDKTEWASWFRSSHRVGSFQPACTFDNVILVIQTPLHLFVGYLLKKSLARHYFSCSPSSSFYSFQLSLLRCTSLWFTRAKACKFIAHCCSLPDLSTASVVFVHGWSFLCSVQFYSKKIISLQCPLVCAFCGCWPRRQMEFVPFAFLFYSVILLYFSIVWTKIKSQLHAHFIHLSRAVKQNNLVSSDYILSTLSAAFHGICGVCSLLFSVLLYSILL